MSQLLKEFHASNPVGEQKVTTLEIAHPSITAAVSDIVDTGGFLRLVRGFSDITAAINDWSPPSTATFRKSGIAFRNPGKDSNGRQELNIQIDNVSRDAWKVVSAIRRANWAGSSRAGLTLRHYLASDLNTIAESHVFTIRNFELDRERVMVTAVFHELVNRAAPIERYLPTVTFPGLKYI